MLGHEHQIIETFEPDYFQNALRDAGHGYLLTTSDAALPAMPGTFQPEAEAGKWTLWRYKR